MASATPQIPVGNPWANSPIYNSPYAGQSMAPNSNAPVAPQYNSTWNPGMAEASVLAGMLNNTNYNTQPLNYLEGEATNPNQSPWARAATIQAGNQKTNAQNQLAGSTAGSEASAEGNLALQGGLSSGARERIQSQGNQSEIAGQQGIANTNQNNLNQIGINDAQNKLQIQEALPGQETQAYQAQLAPIQMYGQAYSQDVSNSMNNANNQNQFNMGLFNTQGQVYGANQQANATQNAPTASCWFITALITKCGLERYKDDSENLERLKVYMGENYKRYAIFYLKDGGQLVQKMDEAKFDWKKFTWFHDAVMEMLEVGEVEAAARIFISMVHGLTRKYWPHCPNRAFLAMQKDCEERLEKFLKVERSTVRVNAVFKGKCLSNLEQLK